MDSLVDDSPVLYRFELPATIPAEDAPVMLLAQFLEHYSDAMLDAADSRAQRRGVDLQAHLQRDFGHQPKLLKRLNSIL